MACILIPFEIYLVLRDRDYAINTTDQILLAEGNLAATNLQRWERGINETLHLVGTSPSIRRLDPRESQAIINETSKIFPHRSIRLWTLEGELLASPSKTVQVDKSYILNRPFFQQTRQGKSARGVYENCLTGGSCYLVSIPVFAADANPLTMPSAKPIGVLTSATRLEDTGADSGLESEAQHLRDLNSLTLTGKPTDTKNQYPSLQNKEFNGFEVLMVSKNGNVIFPLSNRNNSISLLSASEIANGPWGPMVKAAQQSSRRGEFKEIEAERRLFLAYTKTIDSNWSIIAIRDKSSITEMVQEQIIESTIRALAILGLITLLITIASRNAAKPIQVAARAVREFSLGNFDTEITSNRTDEIGELYNDINQTGKSLRGLLNEKLAHAITDEQLHIATGIQQEFVLRVLPSTSRFELAARFEPAYEIGADWYDAISIGDVTYVVIADVCDKGIPSALFMSVFRSLLHYSLLEVSSNYTVDDIPTIIQKSITQVNEYMAANHPDVVMFATVFLGAFDYNIKRLYYISAGHESPLILRSKGITESLEVSGPAIGIFPGAKYIVKCADLCPGEMLLTYTDGLIDTRNPRGESYGIERVKAMLALVDPASTTASELLESAIKQANHYRADADKFDDTTILVMKVNL